MKRLVEFSEPQDGPPRRILLTFDQTSTRNEQSNGSWAVLLFNDIFPSVQAELLDNLDKLPGHKFEEGQNVQLGRHLVLKDFHLEINPTFVEKSPPLSTYVLASDGQSLVIPLENARNNGTYIAIGLIVTGKQFIRSKIDAARFLRKDEPTPFIADASGDSYNDSYFKEPRIIESHPETVFKAIEDIMCIAKKLFAQKNYQDASKKFRKAFHYCHKYYPSDLSSSDLQLFTKLKISSVQNLALASLKTGDFHTTLEATNFALSMPEVENSPNDKAKALYRRGKCYLANSDDQKALEDLEASQVLIPDNGTRLLIMQCKKIRQERHEKLKKALKKAF